MGEAVDQRRVLIIAAVVVFALAGIAVAVIVGVVAWPAVFGDRTTIVTKVDDPSWDVPQLPEDPEEPPVDTPNEPPPTKPPAIDPEPIEPDPIEPEPIEPEPIEPEQPAVTSTLTEIDLLPGVWQTVQGNDRQPYGSAYQFFPPTSGNGGGVYLADDPYAAENWIEAEYELGAQGYLTISPVSYGLWAVSSSFAIQFPDMNTMYMWSLGVGDESMPAAILVRVQ
jgi:hypothetical protein